MPSTDSANARPLLRSLPETVLWEGVLGSLSGCTSAPSMAVPQELHLDDGAVSGFISQHFQSLKKNGISLESPCLPDFSAASEPPTSQSTLALCPSLATLQPKLKPLSQGFDSDYPGHARKWTLMSGDQNKAYNKGGPSCGQQQWGKVEQTE